MRLTVLQIILYTGFSIALHGTIPNISFVILSQNNEYYRNLSVNLKEGLQQECNTLIVQNVGNIFVSTEDFNIDGDWTIFPLIEPILAKTKHVDGWVVFLEDRTKVNLSLLLEELQKYDIKEEIWIGHALHDEEATIIHHFAFHQDPTFFKYPNYGSGFAITLPLLKKLHARLQKQDFTLPDFHIDPSHEFALFVYHDGKGQMIQNANSFCAKKGTNCATYPEKIQWCTKSVDFTVHFAVKTFHQFHKDRVKVVNSTWRPYSRKITFFSDVQDDQIPTVSLGIKNTNVGHCEKTMAILQYVYNDFKDNEKMQWLALVDDDTILSVSRMNKFLACQNSSNPLIFGERYRFGPGGFDYATGGAGTLISRKALEMLAPGCSCPRPDAPDDMVLGACAHNLGVPLVHVPQMHQARPEDYAPGRLSNMDAMTFHKHWMTDPIKIYDAWFRPDDEIIINMDNTKQKTEL